MINGAGLIYGNRKSNNNKDQKEISPLTNNKKSIGCCMLANAAFFNLEFVLIIINKNKSFLGVIGDNRILTGKEYKTAKGAKIAFLKNFRSRVKGKKMVKPEWWEISYDENRINVKKTPDYVKRAIEFIISRKDEEIKNLKPKDVAKAVNININLLSSLFEQKQNISISGFIRREKIHIAYFTLEKNQDVLIPELSERLGFKTLQKFEKEFEKYYDVSPGRFKENVKKRNKGTLKPAHQERTKSVFI